MNYYWQGKLQILNSYLEKKDLETISSYYLPLNKNIQLFKYHGKQIDCNDNNPLNLENEIDNYFVRKDNSLIFKNIIFTNDENIVFNKAEGKYIVFTNCICQSSLWFKDSPLKIDYENCFFNDLFLGEWSNNTEIISCICNHLNINTGLKEERKILINASLIGQLDICDSNGEKFSFISNLIRKLFVYNTREIHNFSYEQLACFDKDLGYISKKKLLASIYYNKSLPESIIPTLSFIQNLDCVKDDPRTCNLINYIISSKIKRSWPKKLFLELVGYFYKPERLFVEAFSIIFIFAFIFYYVISLNKNFELVSKWQKIITSLETSFLLFIGNFDTRDFIRPVRIIGYIETFLGYLTLNSFLISFGRKYLK